MEDEVETGLLGLVRLEHLGHEAGPEVRDRGPDRDAGADAADREVLVGKPVGAYGDAELGVALGAGPSGSPGAATPDTSPFTSATKTGTPCAESCSAMSCRVFVLPVPVAPAMSPWRVIMRRATCTLASGNMVPSWTPRPRSTGGRPPRRRPRSSPRSPSRPRSYAAAAGTSADRVSTSSPSDASTRTRSPSRYSPSSSASASRSTSRFCRTRLSGRAPYVGS